MTLFFFILSIVFAAALLYGLRRRDRRYLERRTRQAMREGIKREIEREQKAFYEHREKFEEALTKAARPTTKKLS